MTSFQPPPLAVWLLRTVRGTGTDDALVGDLYEEFQDTQSSVWFWKQALVAVVFSRAVRSYVLVLPAIATGPLAFAVLTLPLWLLGLVNPWPFDLWTQRVLNILGCFMMIATGWMVGTIHRPRWVTALLLNIALWCAWQSSQIVWVVMAMRDLPVMQSARWSIYLSYAISLACLLFGGALGGRRRHGEQGDRAAPLVSARNTTLLTTRARSFISIAAAFFVATSLGGLFTGAQVHVWKMAMITLKQVEGREADATREAERAMVPKVVSLVVLASATMVQGVRPVSELVLTGGRTLVSTLHATASGETSRQKVPADMRLVGTWRGRGTEGPNTYQIELQLERLTVGQRAGKVSYGASSNGAPPCTGNHVLTDVRVDGTHVFAETIETAGTFCLNGRAELRLLDDGKLKYEWFIASVQEPLVFAVLERQVDAPR